MGKIEEAINILASLGLPRAQQNERSALTLLALADIGPKDAWRKATQPALRIWDIMGFMRERYGKTYAANTREAIRRQTIHQFEQACLVRRNIDDPSRPTNSGKTVYTLTPEATCVIRTYGTRQFKKAASEFIQKHGRLQEAYKTVARDTECL